MRVRFDCATTPDFYNWEAPIGFDGPITVVVAGAAGGQDPGDAGRPGKGAIIQATLTIPTAVKRITGEVGCSGEKPQTQGLPGGSGGTPAGDADGGGAGGGGTYLRAGDAFFTTISAEIYAGGGGGSGGEGSGFGHNSGGDGGSAGVGGSVNAQRGEAGDLGDNGGGAGGGFGPPCANQRRGLDGGSAGATGGGGGGGGGGGFRGGCGGGAGFFVMPFGNDKLGSGGGGQSGSGSISGTARQTGYGPNRGDGYVIITYEI